MRGPFAMNEDPQIGIFAKQSPCCAGMVKMNVRQQDGFEIRDRKSARHHLPSQSFQSGCRPRVENGGVAAGFKKNSADRMRPAHPVEIEYRRGIHLMEWYGSIGASDKLLNGDSRQGSLHRNHNYPSLSPREVNT